MLEFVKKRVASGAIGRKALHGRDRSVTAPHDGYLGAVNLATDPDFNAPAA